MNKKAFTLAEIIVVLTLLGAIAVITVPTALNKSSDKANMTRVKKALPVYEKVIEQMRIVNGITSVEALKSYANDDGQCTNVRKEFKIKKDNGNNKCQFQTYDGVWWDVTNIDKTIISPLKDGNNYLTADYANKSLTEEDGKKAFYLTLTEGDATKGHAFLVNDYNTDTNNACPIKKTLAYAKIIDISEACATEVAKARTFYPNACVNPDGVDDCSNCYACSVEDGAAIYEYDEDGNYVAYYEQCSNLEKREGCSYFYDGTTGNEYFDCTDAVKGEGCSSFNDGLTGSDYDGCTGVVNGVGVGCSYFYDATTGIRYNGCTDAAKGEGCYTIQYLTTGSTYTGCTGAVNGVGVGCSYFYDGTTRSTYTGCTDAIKLEGCEYFNDRTTESIYTSCTDAVKGEGCSRFKDGTTGNTYEDCTDAVKGEGCSRFKDGTTGNTYGDCTDAVKGEGCKYFNDKTTGNSYQYCTDAVKGEGCEYFYDNTTGITYEGCTDAVNKIGCKRCIIYHYSGGALYSIISCPK